MKKTLKNLFSNIKVTRFARIKSYVDNIEQKFTLTNTKDKEIVGEINKLIEDRGKRIEKLVMLNAFLYVGAYFSFFSIIFPDMIFFKNLTFVIKSLVSVLGTTFFIVCIFLTGKLIELYYQDLNLLTAHIVSIYTKNKLPEEPLFTEENKYNEFISFFKNRGF